MYRVAQLVLQWNALELRKIKNSFYNSNHAEVCMLPAKDCYIWSYSPP